MSQEQEQNLLSSAAGDTGSSDSNNHLTDRASNDESPGEDNALFLRRVAAAMGASGVTMGAFGAHALKETLTGKGTTEIWHTATVYQLFHAAAVLSLAAAAASQNRPEHKPIAGNHLRAGKLMGVGNFLFSGSIYFLALDIGPKMILGPITPLGGLLMIGGWIVVGLA